MVWYNPGTWFKKSSTTSPKSTEYKETVTTQPAQKLGVTVTDYTTGESVRTDTSNNGGKIVRTYRRGSSAGTGSTPAPIGQQEALTQLEQNSLIASTPKILEDTGRIKPTTTTTTTTTNNPPIQRVYYSDNQNFNPVDPNGITIYTDKKGNVVGDSRSDIDVPIGFNVNSFYMDGNNKVRGSNLLTNSLKGLSSTTSYTTSTKTYDFNKLEGNKKLLTFETPSGVTSVVSGPEDRIGVSKTGDINVYSPGVEFAKGDTWINEKGETLYTNFGLTQTELLKSARSKSKLADIKITAGSIFTSANPIGLVSAYNLGSFTVNKITGGRWGMDRKTYITKMENIEKNTLATVASNNAFTFTLKSPVVQISALPLAGAVAGGVVQQVGLYALTVPGINTVLAPGIIAGSGMLINNAGTIINVGAPAVSYLIGRQIETRANRLVNMGVTTTSGAFTTSFAQTGLEFYAFAKGFNTGLEKGLPIQYRGVQVGQTTVSQGFYSGTTGKPIYTKTLTNIGPNGELTYTKGWGISNKMVAYDQTGLTTAYTPSGKIETTLYLENVKAYGTPGINVQSAYNVASFTYGTKANVYNDQYLNDFFKQKGFNEQTTNALSKYFKSQNSYEVYGSTATKAQASGYRTPKDLDVVFFKETAKQKAQEIVNIINLNQGRTVINRGGMTFYLDKTVAKVQPGTGQILYNNVKAFDIHGVDLSAQFQATPNAFGFTKLDAINVGGVKTSQLSQEGINKLSSVGSLQTTGVVGPDLVKRGKDIADFYVIQKELIQVKGGSGSISTAVDLTTNYYASATSYYGEGSFSNYPKLFAYSSPSVSPSVSPGVVSLGLLPTSPSFGSRSSPSAVRFSSTSVSISSSVSPSISPSLSASPSVSRSIGRSFASVSPSLSRSPSVSISAYPSPSISPSPSPSISPSPSPSPSNSLFFLPFLKGGLWDGPSSNIVKGGKRRTAYTPSYSALVFKQFGKYKAGALSKSGIDYRPITKDWANSISKSKGVKLRL